MPTYKITLPGGETYRVESPSELTDAQAYAAVQSQISSGSVQETGRGGVLPSLAEGFATSFTDIPLGLASIVSSKPEETSFGKFSLEAEKRVQDILGIDPTKEATTAEAVAGGLGSLASFFVPGTLAAKGAKAIGAGATAIRGAGLAAAGAQAVPLGGAEQVQRRMGEEAATGVEVSGEDRLASQQLGAAIGLSELVPLRRFMGPLEAILARVPLSKASGASKTVADGVKSALRSATEEGAQEALAQTAQNLIEQGYYNPDLDITEGLLGSAGVGGAAGGTLDVVLQLMSGRKAAGFRKKASQLQTTLAKQGAEKRPEQIRADANMGLDKLRAAAPVGNISIKREIPTTGIASFNVIGEDGQVASSFSTPEAAVLAAEQYEKDAGGLAKFNRPSIAEMSGQVAVKPTKQEKAEGKKLAKALKQSGGLTPAPAQTPTTPAGQAAAVQGVAQVADATGATPADVASLTKPVTRGKKRIAPVEAAPAEGLPSPERITPPPVSTTAAEIPAPERAVTEEAPSAFLEQPATEQPSAFFDDTERQDESRLFSVSPTAPVSPSEAPPTAVPAPKAVTPPKPFTTSIEALFKPIANTPEDVAKLADFNNRKKDIAKELNKRLSPITGKNTRVKLIDAVNFTDKAGRTQFAEGEAKGGNIIYLSYNLYDPKLTNEQLVDKLFDVMNHEVIHSLTNLGVFNPGETKTLFNAAERIKYQGNKFSYYDRAYAMYSRMPNITEEIIREEAVAEMFRDYRSGKLKLEGTPKGLVQRAIEFFRRIFSGFRDAKVGQVFKDIESGKIGAREARAVKGGVRKLSAVPQDRSQEADKAFKKLAGDQRGAPELLMVEAQNALRGYESGPALTYAMEHVGDLTHRMGQYGNEYPSYEFGIEFVAPKVRTGLRVVTNRVDAERIAKLPDDPTLKKYADAHAKLKVYNEAQRAARDAAVALGRKDLRNAERNLLILQGMIDNGTYVKVAGSYDPQFDGGVRKLSALPSYLGTAGDVDREAQKNLALSRATSFNREYLKRTPELQEAVVKRVAGEITQQEYERIVDTYRPVMPFQEAPAPTPEEIARKALSEGTGQSPEKAAKYGVPSSVLKDGDDVQIRLDIPSYTGDYKAWVVTVHTPRTTNPNLKTSFDAGTTIGYESVAVATDVYLGVNQESAFAIAKGVGATGKPVPKGTIATMLGKWKNASPEEAYRMAQEAMNDPSWRQVGMDPFRHAYFYDRKTMEPIYSADMVIQIGPLVLAKNANGQRLMSQVKADASFTQRKFSIIPSWTSFGYPPPGVNSNDTNENSPYRVSQRFPTATRATENALTEDLRINLEAMMRDPIAFAKNIELIRNYDGFPVVEGETPEQTAQRFKSLVVENLLALYDAVDPKIRKRSKLWYVGARRITTEWSKKYNLPDSAVASVIANLSPQMDWFQNVSVAERVLDVVTNQRNFRYTDKMEETAKRIYAKEKYEKNLANIRGKKFGELTDSVDKAMWLRIFDETYNDTGYRIVSPEGYFMDYAKNLDGSNTKIAWKSNVAIAKAIESIENPTKENINTLLGQMHKVRNFYNNILSPGSSGGDVTIDTHAVAAALWRPLSGTSLEVDHNFGSTSEKGRPGTSNSSITGVQGLYGIYADAYREAAMARNVLPREMQSITWEAVRSIYPDTLKSNKKTIAKIDALWNEYKNGSRTAEQVRKELTDEYGKSISVTAWSGSAGGVAAKKSDTSYTPKLSGSGVSGGAAGMVGGIGEPSAGGNPKQIAKQIAAKVSKPNISDSQLEDLAGQANEQVRKSVRKLSILPQTIPMPPEMEAANERIFAAKYVPSRPGEKLMAFLGGFGNKEGIMNMADMFRTYFVQKGGQITKREREAFISGAISQEEAQFAEYSATAAQDMQARASHYTVEVGYNGAPTIMGLNAKREQVRLSEGADPNSAYMYVEENQKDSPFKVLEMIYEGGPNGESLIEQFRSYAIAQVSKRRIAEGKEVPSDITEDYIAGADALGEQFPIIKQAFESYQRFNTKLLEAVRDSGYLSQELFEEFTDQQNYYSMYRQLEEGDVVQGISGGLGSRIRFKAYEGSTTGNLMADPIVAMMHNVAFWNNVILRTLATQKSFRVGEATGVVKRLRAFEDDEGNVTIEEPSRDEGFDDKKFYTYINGVEIPFASKDPLFTIGLSGNDFVSPGLMLEVAGMPANFLREMVTRDPSFMVANLLRDSVSTWVLAGSGANPYQTFKGMVSALRSSSSFNALRSHAVVGSFDEAQKPMAGIVEGMRGKLTKAQGLTSINSALKSGWQRLGSLSEASDAATRIAVYEAAKRDGASDFTAAYRALSIMNFSRSGHSAALRTLTRLIPFLNARIQGFDVLYTGIKAATGVVTGRDQLDFERQRGTHVLVRGMGLMAATMALALINDDDEAYKELPPYIKDANILIPIPGETGKYIQIPKPFEAGFLFMTVPETFYNVAKGDRSMRSATKLMFNQFGSTFGFNPIPQVALPVLENMLNYDFYTGQPLVSPGLEKLDPSLQYNASTSYVARGLSKLSGFLPFNYDFEEGRFAPISPVKMDNLISGYGGPLISYLAMGVGGVSYAFGADNQGLPIAGSQLPVIRRFFVDARDKQPQAATEAYELYQIVDRVNRTISRLKKSGDTEALREYREENINVLRIGKQVRKMADNLNNIRAQVRRLEADKMMPMDQKLEKMRELRSREARVTKKIYEINQQLGR